MGEGWINVHGKKQEVIEKFQETGLSRQSTEKLLALLTKEKNLICEDETYQMDPIKEKSDGKMLGLNPVS